MYSGGWGGGVATKSSLKVCMHTALFRLVHLMNEWSGAGRWHSDIFLTPFSKRRNAHSTKLAGSKGGNIFNYHGFI